MIIKIQKQNYDNNNFSIKNLTEKQKKTDSLFSDSCYFNNKLLFKTFFWYLLMLTTTKCQMKKIIKIISKTHNYLDSIKCSE